MSKIIKFNLICDLHTVRSLEDLQENFCIDDVLKYYKDGVLEKWLSVRGFQTQCDAVRSINAQDDYAIAEALSRIFGMEIDKDILRKSTYTMTRMQEDLERYRQYEAQRYQADQIIRDYESGYTQCIVDILENKEDAGTLKAIVQRIVDCYLSIFERDYLNLFNILYDAAPLALFVMLAHKPMREKYLLESSDSVPHASVSTERTSSYAKRYASMFPRAYAASPLMSSALASAISTKDMPTVEEASVDTVSPVEKILNKNRAYTTKQLTALATPKMLTPLKQSLTWAGGKVTGDWVTVVPAGKKCMILYLGDPVGGHSDPRSAKARSAAQHEIAFDEKSVAGAFPIIDGLEYLGYYTNHRLYCLEVDG